MHTMTGPLALAAVMLALGCDGTIGRNADGGPRMDAGSRDAATDAAGMDAQLPDAGTFEAGTFDAGGPDGGSLDASDLDAPMRPDAGTDSGALECRPEPRDCSPSAVTMEDYCIDGTSCYLAAVQASVRGVIMAHPDWFDSTGPCNIILNVDAFMDAVVMEIVGRGICAIRDPNAPGEEVTLKYSNVFTENFDIVASTGCARYGSAIYTSTCFPAWW